jgi:peptidoglycan/xylan/chitin deacetylase (PgdA/CDA1 family)
MIDRANKLKSSVRSAVCTPRNRLLNYLDSPVLVLLYHRVTSLLSDPEMLAVTPDNFRSQMLYLKKKFPVVRFEESWAKVQKPAVAITFDDGYADNALEALPILEEVGVPATFFVSTGTISTLKEFWWHELEHLILEKQGTPLSFTLEDDRFGRVWQSGDLRARQEFYQGIVQLMTNADAAQRDNWLAQLRRWAKAEDAIADTHRAMTIKELRLLSMSKWATIGAHTVTHTQLSSLPLDKQREEIVESKKQLEEWLDREVTTFSYPFGRRCHYTSETVKLCREAGFTKVAANFPGQVHRWTDPHQIPRHLIRNWPIEIFTEKLRGFWTR